MLDRNTKAQGRPKILATGDSTRLYVNLPEPLGAQIRELAASERRTVTAQIELLIERGLRSYGLEVSAA